MCLLKMGGYVKSFLIPKTCLWGEHFFFSFMLLCSFARKMQISPRMCRHLPKETMTMMRNFKGGKTDFKTSLVPLMIANPLGQLQSRKAKPSKWYEQSITTILGKPRQTDPVICRDSLFTSKKLGGLIFRPAKICVQDPRPNNLRDGAGGITFRSDH